MGRWYSGIAAVCLTIYLGTVAAGADQPADLGKPRQITEEHLTYLGRQPSEVASYRDNAFLYEEALRRTSQYTAALEGTDLVWNVSVVEVTKSEVVYSVASVGGILMAILPGPDARAPTSVHAMHWTYPGPPSNDLFNVLAAPKTLRIGKAISVDIAERIRKGDVIPVIGRVQRIESSMTNDSIYDNVVYLTDVRSYEQTTESPLK